MVKTGTFGTMACPYVKYTVLPHVHVLGDMVAMDLRMHQLCKSLKIYTCMGTYVV